MTDIWLASKTRAAINEALAADRGNSYRQWLGRVLPHMSDAYRSDDDGRRTHLGASLIGAECSRALAFGWLWASPSIPRGKKKEAPTDAAARMYRLWNRGHLEEGRFIALLLMIGVQVYQQGADGKQYRISDFGGHFGGSLDGIALGIPDLPPGIPCLVEFKTHDDKSFTDVQEFGVRESKPQHYIQMQMYMGKRGLQYALYMAVNKNTDEIHCEIVMYDGRTDAVYLERAKEIIFCDMLPPRINGASPAFHVCKYMCDHTLVCFHTKDPERNCRTCAHSRVLETGDWVCALTGEVLDKHAQEAGCPKYALHSRFSA